MNSKQYESERVNNVLAKDIFYSPTFILFTIVTIDAGHVNLYIHVHQWLCITEYHRGS